MLGARAPQHRHRLPAQPLALACCRAAAVVVPFAGRRLPLAFSRSLSLSRHHPFAITLIGCVSGGFCLASAISVEVGTTTALACVGATGG